MLVELRMINLRSPKNKGKQCPYLNLFLYNKNLLSLNGIIGSLKFYEKPTDKS